MNVKKEKNVTVVAIRGRMDAVTAPEFEKSLSDLVLKGETLFLLNLSGLDYISSAGLRSFLASAKQLKGKEGKIFFTGLHGPVEEVFKISGFHSIFKIFDSEEAALKEME